MAMSAQALYSNLQSYLRVVARVVDRRGENINVDEHFTIRVTGSNTAYSANLVNSPSIVFDRPRVFVQGTQYTDVVGGDRWFALPDAELFPGESSSVDVELVATSEIADWWADLFQAERIANIWIQGNLDQDRFFEIWNYIEFSEEIEPT
jgi:hypothetical protein